MSTPPSRFPTSLATSSKRLVPTLSPIFPLLSRGTRPRTRPDLTLHLSPCRSSNTAITTNPTPSPSPRTLPPTWPRKRGGGLLKSENGTPSLFRSIRRCCSRSSWRRITWISSLCCEFALAPTPCGPSSSSTTRLTMGKRDVYGDSDLGCRTVATMIKGKSPEEIRKLFHIKNDFTPEEEAQIRRENEWAEE